MSQVVRFPFETKKCRAGWLALHPSFGICEVIAAEGFFRTLLRHDSDALGNPTVATFQADVRDLKEVNPVRDMGWQK